MDALLVREPRELEPVLRGFIRRKERVLICFPQEEQGLGSLYGEMVKGLGGVPIFWGRDLRWKALLRRAFSEYCTAVIGPPEIVLGLSKLALRMGTPLPVRNVLLSGAAPDAWMLETISRSLDCRIPGCCVQSEEEAEDDVTRLARELRRWTSILDFRLRKASGGLSLEMMVFPGEKLPKLPSLAKLQLREWNPEEDVPFLLG